MSSPIIWSGSNAKLLKTNLDFGTNSIVKTGNFSSANNQSAATNVTGLSFAASTDRGGRVIVSIYITATGNLAATYELDVIQKASNSWEVISSYMGDVTGIIFSITTAGQLQYTSTNVSGFSSGLFRWTQTINKV